MAGVVINAYDSIGNRIRYSDTIIVTNGPRVGDIATVVALNSSSYGGNMVATLRDVEGVEFKLIMKLIRKIKVESYA